MSAGKRTELSFSIGNDDGSEAKAPNAVTVRGCESLRDETEQWKLELAFRFFSNNKIEDLNCR